jgi:hypothetical protein
MANTGLIFVPVPAPLTQSAIIISSSFVIAPKLGLKSEFPVDAAGAVACVNRMLDVLVSNGHFTSAPTINRLPDGKSEKVWVGTVEKRWCDLSKGGSSLKVYWGNGGTLTRTANLDLMDHLDQSSINIFFLSGSDAVLVWRMADRSAGVERWTVPTEEPRATRAVPQHRRLCAGFVARLLSYAAQAFQGEGRTTCNWFQLPESCEFGLKLGSSLMTYSFDPLSQAWSY